MTRAGPEGPRARKGPGALPIVRPTEKLIELLEAQGLTVRRVIPARGHWTHLQQDVQRFQAVVRCPGESWDRTLGSWDTITACARRGIDPIGAVPRGGTDMGEIRAKPKKATAA